MRVIRQLNERQRTILQRAAMHAEQTAIAAAEARAVYDRMVGLVLPDEEIEGLQLDLQAGHLYVEEGEEESCCED